MTIKTDILRQRFPLENGSVLDHPPVSYSTFGSLNSDKSNVVLVCHALTANSLVSEWWAGLFGSENIFNPDKDFIICLNNLGSPYGTVSPKSTNKEGQRYGLEFPDYTIRDTAKLQIAFLEQLGFDQFKMIIGGSCGGNIAQEIAYELEDNVDQLVLMCCSAHETPWVVAIHESQRIVLQSDTDFKRNADDAAKVGLKGARGFALPFYRSHPLFKTRQSEEDLDKISDFKASSYIQYQGNKFADRYDAHCYYKQLIALDTHNIGRKRGGIDLALSSISAKTLSIGFSTDLLIPVEEQKLLAKHVQHATYLEIETPCGHDAFLIETEKIKTGIMDWIKNI